MNVEQLSRDDLLNMIKSVFPSFPEDKYLGILTDIPRERNMDNSKWIQRRELAENWYNLLKDHYSELGLHGIELIAYPDVGSNNAELPQDAYIVKQKLPLCADKLETSGEKKGFDKVFEHFQLFLAPTEYSTTAPLKNASKKYGFRAATMPGFSTKMIQALKIDYNEVNRRVLLIKDKLDFAIWAKVIFLIDQKEEYKMLFDLRFRRAHASSGRFPDKGTAGNLPSGESYIVPYEGEFEETSMTGGVLPVQIRGNIILFVINENRAFHVESYPKGTTNSTMSDEQDHLKREPAYGNMAELGFGVLEDFGLKPIDEILIDEKLGFHIAFGRSDHFGGIIGPKNFSSAKEVVHLDRIYIPATQPRISVESILLGFNSDQTETIMKNGKYLIF